MTSSPDLVTLANDKLAVVVNPRVGGTITSVKHRHLALEVLGATPWDTIDEPIGSFAARDEAEWLTRYTGGWPLMFPNAGGEGVVDGFFHGFHGEASIAPWSDTATESAVTLRRRFYSVPVAMQRDIRLDGDVLILREHLAMNGPRAVEVMWGQHPTFGSDLLASPFEITSGARRITADDGYDPPSNSLQPGAAGDWPVVPGKRGAVDLSRPAAPLSSVAYLTDFSEKWVSIRRLDNAVAIILSWEAEHFPCAWLWCELGGNHEAPWHGRGHMIGIEPNATWPGVGIAGTRQRGGKLLRLEPGAEMQAEFRLRVYRPDAG